MTDKGYFLGIEATSRTVALLADESGQVVGRGTAGASVYSQVGQERTAQALWTAIVAAFATAGINTRDLLKAELPLPDVDALCIGMSGVERPKDEAAIKRILNEFNLTKNMLITNEARIVLQAGVKTGQGVAVLAGDNSLAFARNSQGQTARAGGGGYLLGDEGSAHWLGLAAVKAALAAADGRGAATRLTEAIELEWKVPPNRPDIISAKVYSFAAGLGSGGNKAQLEDTIENYKRQLALLAPHVERAAAKGDEAASAILDQAADELAQAVRAACKRVGLQGTVGQPSEIGQPNQTAERTSTNAEQPSAAGQKLLLFQSTGRVQPETTTSGQIPLALAGSMLLSNYGELRRRLLEKLPECAAPALVTDAAEGALALALNTGLGTKD